MQSIRGENFDQLRSSHFAATSDSLSAVVVVAVAARRPRARPLSRPPGRPICRCHSRRAPLPYVTRARSVTPHGLDAPAPLRSRGPLLLSPESIWLCGPPSLAAGSLSFTQSSRRATPLPHQVAQVVGAAVVVYQRQHLESCHQKLSHLLSPLQAISKNPPVNEARQFFRWWWWRRRPIPKWRPIDRRAAPSWRASLARVWRSIKSLCDIAL